MHPELLVESSNHVGFLTLNRPGALNALSDGMVHAMRAKLLEWAADPALQVVVVKGAGGKAFCAGGDVRAIYRSFTTSGTLHHEFFATEYELDHLIHRYPKPYVALMDGIVMGGGMGISQGASVRLVTDRTRMAMPEVGIGLFPDVGASYFLSRLAGGLGNYLALTGITIGAADALYAGLADTYLPHETLESFESALRNMRWSQTPSADIDNALQAHCTSSPPAPTLASVRPAIDQYFSGTDVEAIIASLRAESRPQYAEWARRTVDIMSGRSPLMMAVTARQLQLGRNMDLGDCFRMEVRMVRHSFEQGDFMEGVRALLVDKDNTPRWNPQRIEDVSQEMIDAFFPEHPRQQIE